MPLIMELKMLKDVFLVITFSKIAKSSYLNCFFLQRKYKYKFDFTLGLPEGITSIVHLCCGYPTYVDQNDYMKADKTLYIKLVSQKTFKI